MNEDLTRFVESNAIDNRLITKADQVTFRESLSKCAVSLRESVNANETSEGWWVPISFYNRKNYNGRIYNKKLWENVINNQRDIWVGSPMLADHPSDDSDGNPRDICGVWLDAKMDKPDHDGIGLVYGLLMPSGRIGEDLKDHLSKGLKVGTSSSGFGKLMMDGVTVDPDSYLIERLSDWVLNPSQGTYFSYEENHIVNKSQNLKESTNVKENKNVEDSKFTKLEEKKFRRDMESFLEEAASIKDPQERLQEFKEIRSYLEDGACPDLKEKIEEKIAAEEDLIKTAIKEKLELQEELKIESVKDLKEKLTKIVEDTNTISKEASEWKSVAEALQEKLNKANSLLEARPTKEYVDYQRTKITEMRAAMNKVNEKSFEAVKKVVNLNKTFKEANNLYKEQIKGLEEEKAKLFDELKENHKIVEEKNTNLKAYEDELAELKSQLDIITSKYDAVQAAYEAEVADKANTVGSFTTQVEDLNKDVEALNTTIADKDRDIEDLNKVIEEQRNMLTSLATERSQLTSLTENQKAKIKSLSQELLESQRKLVYDRPTKKVEEKKNLNAIDSYYESLYETYGNAITPYENTIKGSRTLTEAKNTFLTKILSRLPASKKIESARIPENLYTTPEQRMKKLGESNFTKGSVVDRMPKGWN